MAVQSQGSRDQGRERTDQASTVAPATNGATPAFSTSRVESRSEELSLANATLPATAVQRPSLASDPRSILVQTMQQQFSDNTLANANEQERDALAQALANSEHHQSQFAAAEAEGRRLERLGLLDRAQHHFNEAERNLKLSVTSLLGAQVDRTIAGLAERVTEFEEREEKITSELELLQSLAEEDPRRIAGLSEVVEDELKGTREILGTLRTLHSELIYARENADSLELRSASLRDLFSQATPQEQERLRTEADATLDASLFLLAEAEGKVALEPLAQGIQQFDSINQLQRQRREAFAESISTLGSALDQHQKRIRDEIRHAQSNINESLERTREIERDNSRFGFVPLMSLVTGVTGAREQSRDDLLEKAKDHNRVASQLIEHYREAKEARQEFITQQQEAFRLERQGSLDEAQKHFNRAHTSLVDAYGSIDSNQSDRLQAGPYRNWQIRNRATQQRINAAIQSSNNWEYGLEIAHTTTVVAGATVATIATAGAATPALTAAGASFWTIGGVSIAGGTTGGLVIGTLSNGVEQGEAVRLGVRSGDEALSEFGSQFRQDAVTSFSTAATTTLGIGASGRVLSQATQHGAKLPTLLQRTYAGMAGGGTAATANTFIDTTQSVIARNNAIAQFELETQDSSLPPLERERLLDSYLAERGLGFDQIAWRGTVNIVSGTLAGGVGANTGVLRESSRHGLQRFGAATLDVGADLGIGLATTYASDGTLTFEQALQQSSQSLLIGNSISAAGPRRGPSTTPQTVNTGPLIGTDTPTRPPAPPMAEPDILDRILNAPSIEAERNARMVRSEDESALVGVAAGNEPPYLSAAHDGPSYNAGNRNGRGETSDIELTSERRESLSHTEDTPPQSSNFESTEVHTSSDPVPRPAFPEGRIRPAHEETTSYWQDSGFMKWLGAHGITHPSGVVPGFADGGAGRAYFVDETHVVKFTRNPVEANVAMMIQGSDEIPLVQSVRPLGDGMYAILSKKVEVGAELPREIRDAADYMTLVIDEHPEIRTEGFPQDRGAREALILEALDGERPELVQHMHSVMDAIELLRDRTGFLHDDAGPTNIGMIDGRIVFPDLGPNQTQDFSVGEAFEAIRTNRESLGLTEWTLQ